MYPVYVYVRPSVRLQNFDFNEMWHVGRGRRMMHDGMQYDPTRCKVKVKVTSPSKFESRPFSKSYLLRHLQWELATDHGFLN